MSSQLGIGRISECCPSFDNGENQELLIDAEALCCLLSSVCETERLSSFKRLAWVERREAKDGARTSRRTTRGGNEARTCSD